MFQILHMNYEYLNPSHFRTIVVAVSVCSPGNYNPAFRSAVIYYSDKTVFLISAFGRLRSINIVCDIVTCHVTRTPFSVGPGRGGEKESRYRLYRVFETDGIADLPYRREGRRFE